MEGLHCVNLTWHKTEKKKAWEKRREKQTGREEKGEEEGGKRGEGKEEEKNDGKSAQKERLFNTCQESEHRSYHRYLKLGET